MSAKKIWFMSSITFLVILFSLYFLFAQYQDNILKEVKEHLNNIYQIERSYIKKLPTYQDYITNNKKQQLRTFLLNDHLQVTKNQNIKPIKSQKDIQTLKKSNQLIYMDVYKNDYLFYFYNVRKENRYLAPKTLEGLIQLTQKLNQKLAEKIHTNIPNIKIAISSAIRTETYQKQLQHKNSNAAFKSSHSYGISFDIFYDDFIVEIPIDKKKKDNFMVSIKNMITNKMKFILGDSLRRQFHALLVDTLLELQEEKFLYAIWEKNQKCYHVTIL